MMGGEKPLGYSEEASGKLVVSCRGETLGERERDPRRVMSGGGWRNSVMGTERERLEGGGGVGWRTLFPVGRGPTCVYIH